MEAGIRTLARSTKLFVSSAASGLYQPTLRSEYHISFKNLTGIALLLAKIQVHLHLSNLLPGLRPHRFVNITILRTRLLSFEPCASSNTMKAFADKIRDMCMNLIGDTLLAVEL